MSFRGFSKLHAITLKSSKRNPQHLWTSCVCFSHRIVDIYSRTESCNENNVTPCAFLLNSPSHTSAKQHDCVTIASLYDAVIFIYNVYLHHISVLCKKATMLVVLIF